MTRSQNGDYICFIVSKVGETAAKDRKLLRQTWVTWRAVLQIAEFFFWVEEFLI